MKESNYKKLVYNTAIFAIGNFGSKVLTFLIVPLYTYVLTTAEYGVIDLFITSLGMVIPFSTMMVNEALIRYVLGKELTPKEAASNCFAVFLFGAAISVLFTPLYKVAFDFDEYIWIFVALLVLRTFNQVFSEYFRAVNQNVKFTIFGLITTATILGFNVVFLLFLKLGIRGYLYATLLSAAVGTLYILIFSDFFQVVSLKCIDKNTIRMLLKYSVPLIPNSLMWWIMSAGDKYIINYFLGDGANGLYSLSSKVPQIINMIYSLFIQAWQMSAIEVSESKDKTSFYHNVFHVTSFVMGVVTCGIIMVVKPLYLGIMSASFAEAWKYVPLLSVATIISCYASYFSVVYRSKIHSSVLAGDEIAIDGARIIVHAPKPEMLSRAMAKMEEANAQLASVSDWTCSLDDLMAKPYPSSDTSIANQSSIVFTFEYAGIRNLFCGDAWAENIPGGKYDLVKLPHHGSIRNISDALLSRIQADTFLICADGTSHPNKQTIAKLLQQYGNISIYSNYSWWMNGFLMTDDMKYIKNGNLKLLII